MRVLARFMMSASQVAQFPAPSVPEVAFLGRSNVGKSSLINSLLGAKHARTSSTPGRTRSINFFEVRWAGKPHPEVIFADLPGYGYTKISRVVSDEWAGFIDPYLSDRPTLALCLALVDISVPPQANDRLLVEFLSAGNREFVIVATKSDRLSNNQLTQALAVLQREFPLARIVPFSSRTGVGRESLWQEIRGSIAGMPARSDRAVV
jgi:GTP-binding protein